MNSAPVSISRLLMPLKTAVATKARRHAPSAAASSELAGCCAEARAEFIKDCVPLLRTRSHARARKVRRSATLARRGAFALNATITDQIYPVCTRFGRVHDH